MNDTVSLNTVSNGGWSGDGGEEHITLDARATLAAEPATVYELEVTFENQIRDTGKSTDTITVTGADDGGHVPVPVRALAENAMLAWIRAGCPDLPFVHTA